jgi:hypothetical protein
MSDKVHEAASAVYAEADGDVKAATDIFEARVRSDIALRDVLTDPLIRGACYAAITAVCRQQRRRIWTAPVYSGESGETNKQGSRVEALAQSNLMMFPLPGGKRLGEATREEIAQAGEFFVDRGRDMLHKGSWLNLVAAKMPEGKRADQVFTEAELNKLKDQANG